MNLRREAFDVYIGRAGRGQDGYFGNPFPIKERTPAALAKVMQDFESYFFKRVASDAEFRRRVLELRGKRLGCFCKPGRCHGDVIAQWVDEQTAPAPSAAEVGRG